MMLKWLILSIVPVVVVALALCVGAAIALWDMSKNKEEDN
jgi:hypothetical protein